MYLEHHLTLLTDNLDPYDLDLYLYLCSGIPIHPSVPLSKRLIYLLITDLVFLCHLIHKYVDPVTFHILAYHRNKCFCGNTDFWNECISEYYEIHFLELICFKLVLKNKQRNHSLRYSDIVTFRIKAGG